MTTVDPTPKPAGDAPGFDPDALRDRYRTERDKRVRPDGNDQYLDIGDHARYLADPYVERIERDPLTHDVEVLIVGGGFGGLLAGARLADAGIDDVWIVEKGGDFGGTWYWNRYPGAQCDIESYIYLPLLEELGYTPTEKYVHAPEILAHSRAIGEHWGLYDRTVFQTEVTDLRWDDAAGRWTVETDRGDAIRARWVVMSSGPLHRPKLPGIEGIDDYAGHSFHTSRWDYHYTGGGPDGGLDRLAGKRVGIIGTGATAVQCVPHLARTAEHLYVFQRTPSSIDVRGNRPTPDGWEMGLEPGWQRRRMENFNNLVSGIPEPEDLVNDGWTDIIGRLLVNMRRAGESADTSAEGLARSVELADFEKMNQIRDRVDELVDDPATAEALKPWYRQFCKRPCFHDDYLPTFNRPNVTLVDTDGLGIDRVTERGVVVDGTEYAVDCLIYATGFEVGTDYTRRAGCEVHGRAGQTLTDYWADGMRTLHGMHARGFPNLFVVGPQQGGFTANYPHMLDEISGHIAYLLTEARARGATRIEVTPEAEQAWVEQIIDLARLNEDFLDACTPGYYNNEGHIAGRKAQNTFYGKGSVAFFALIDQWRQAGDLAGLELHGPPG